MVGNEKIVLILRDESRTPPRMKGIGLGGPIGIKTGSPKARYDIYFTDRRIIAAVLFSTSDITDILPAAPVEASLKWKKIRDRRRQELTNKSPDEILHHHPENFEVPFEKIKTVDIKKGLFGAKLKISAYWKGNLVEFDVPVPKSRLEEIGRILSLYLPGKYVHAR